jgi:hypothetical protein
MQKDVVVRKGFWIAGLLLMLGVTVAAYGFSRAGERVDCPGTVLCPLTGEEVCKDQCPLTDASRADCPGKVECPLNGELVCRDKCPLGADSKTAETDEELPACCLGEK